jgi:hypothetical protein
LEVLKSGWKISFKISVLRAENLIRDIPDSIQERERFTHDVWHTDRGDAILIFSAMGKTLNKCKRIMFLDDRLAHEISGPSSRPVSELFIFDTR